MRFKELLFDSRGLFGRKEGDQFVNDNGVTAEFSSIQLYPSPQAGAAYEDPKQMLAQVNKIESKLRTNIEWVNTQHPKTMAFAVAVLKGSDDKPILWGRWYTSVPAGNTSWKNKEVPPGWKLNTRTAVKARTGFSPQDLIKTDNKFNSAAAIIATVQKNGAPQEIVDGLKMAAAGQMPVFKNMKDSNEAIRDYLGEIIQPIALMSGLVKGDASKAMGDILQVPYADCTVYWPQDRAHNLVDSIFINPNNGATLGVSSKGNSGANASVGNIYNAVHKAKNTSPKLVKKYAKTANIVETLATTKAKEGPILLAKQLGLISEDLATEIFGLLKVVTSDSSGLSNEAKKIFAAYGSKPGTKGFNVGFVLLTNVAKMLADHINQDPEFSKGCLAFLNQASIIQVYTTTAVKGNDVVVTGFRCVFPPNYSGQVLVDAGKNYSSTMIKGRMSFKL
mgnify:CR=1 FL=1